MNEDTSMAEQDNQDSDDQPRSPNRELREAYDRLKAENEALAKRVRRGAFVEAGINPEAGIGKLLYASYDGEPDADKVREFAAQYEVVPSAVQVEKSADQSRWDTSQQIADQIAAASKPLPNQTDRTVRINEYEREGDWMNAMALQIEAITEQHGG